MMKLEIKDTVINRWLIVIVLLTVLYLLFFIVSKTNESRLDKNLTLKLIEQIKAKNDSIISAKNKEINGLLKENEKSKKRVQVSENIIDSLENQIQSKTSTYRRRKKKAGEFTDAELVNYWRNEVN
jgi:hypothetical protein